MVRTGPVPVRTTSDGRLESEPTPLTLRDVVRDRAGSPQRAVMQLLFWAQWGNFLGIVDAYHPAVVRHLGSLAISDAYRSAQRSIAATRPRLVAGRPAPGGDMFVGVELLSTRRGPRDHSFRLRRERHGWKVVFDTLLASTLNHSRTVRIARDPDQPGGWAREPGPAAARRYAAIRRSLLP